MKYRECVIGRQRLAVFSGYALRASTLSSCDNQAAVKWCLLATLHASTFARQRERTILAFGHALWLINLAT